MTATGNSFSAGGDVKEMAAADGLHAQAPYDIRHWSVFQVGKDKTSEVSQTSEV